MAPSWPRLPLSLLLRGEKPIYSNGDKIVGGAVVEPNSVPSQISLQRRSGNTYSQSCDGAILGASTILNAAHCVEKHIHYHGFICILLGYYINTLLLKIVSIICPYFEWLLVSTVWAWTVVLSRTGMSSGTRCTRTTIVVPSITTSPSFS